MAKRIVLAALLAGVVLFFWEFVAHEVLPLGEAGIRALDNETATMATLQANIKEPGLYLFPAPGLTPGMTSQQQQQAMRAELEKIHTGPYGLLAIYPRGFARPFARQLVTQFVADLAAMLLAAILLAPVGARIGFPGRVLFVTAMALLPMLRVGLPSWNWYAFPATYVMGQLAIDLVGFFAGGLVLAWLIKPANR